MDNDYTFDAVCNVPSVANNASLPASGNAGGNMSHAYTYDGLYRLVSASGTYRGAEGKSASYTLAMSYDNMHRIKSKSQHLTQQGVQFNGTLNAGYDLTYTYQDSLGHKFQLSKIEDLNYRTEGTPNEKIDNGHRYLYDANGNLVYINTSRVKKDGKEDEQATEKKYRWDEENRLLASDENGFVANYWYDADGERTVKSSGEGEAVYVNSEFSAGVTNTAKFSLYVSPYLVASQGGKYTKHIYIGSQRIVSKLGDLASYGADPRRIPYAGTEADGVSVDYQTKYNRQQQAIKDNYADFGVPYNGEDNNDYVNGEGFCCNDNSPEAARAKMLKARAVSNNFHDTEEYERMQFYYHPDHLGSSSYITNLDGEVVQHIEYVPFGEVFIEERNNTWNTPYLFNAKEYDEETGMYYYGARYYEPRISLWMSTDPMQEKFWAFTTYSFSKNNPTIYIDPTGKSPIYAMDGTFLGTDDKGLQGEYIIMSKKLFKQNMNHADAKKVAYLGAIKDEVRQKIWNHHGTLGSRPDWDGKLTLSEANEWYRKGTGEKLFVDINSLDLSNFRSLGEEYVGKTYSFNLLIYGNPADGLVFGSVTFLRTPNDGVKILNDYYDFDIKKWSGMNIIRNIETYIGEWVAGRGKPYPIVFYGEQKLKPKNP